tara:strand:+ start:468 stop:1157 length:690 start_codon:yes stop_codon:yes gene_type:complete
MATVKYEDLLPDIIPMVPGCTDTLIENTIRNTVIELCEKSEVYQAELDPVDTVANTYEYDFEPPTGTVVHKILWATYDGNDLEAVSSSLLEEREPKWRESTYVGTPTYFIKQTSSQFWLVPIPSVTKVGSTIVRAIIKPTHTSTACEADVMNDFRDAIVNGTLFRLLRIPNKDWSDLTGAEVYAQLWQEGLSFADRKARFADSPVARKVKYGGYYTTPYRRRRATWEKY